MPVPMSRCNADLVDASSGALHSARRSHMIKYEMITGHFTAQRWNSTEKSFPHTVRVSVGMKLKEKTSYHHWPGSSQAAQER